MQGWDLELWFVGSGLCWGGAVFYFFPKFKEFLQLEFPRRTRGGCQGLSEEVKSH